MGEKYTHLTDTTLSNGQEMFDPRNSLFQNLSKSTFFYLICNSRSYLNTTTFIR